MSDYCGDCKYSVSKKTGEKACPFNSLYWDFLIRHEERFSSNGRVSRAYSTWQRMSKDKRAAYLETAKGYLENLEAL